MRRYVALSASVLMAAIVASCSDDDSGGGGGQIQPDSGTPDGGEQTRPGWDVNFGLPGIAGRAHPTVLASARVGQDQVAIAGTFEQVGSVIAPYVALWNGKEWTAIGQGLSETVHQMVATPGGELFGSTEHLTEDQQGYASKLLKWNKSWAEVAAFDGKIADMDVDEDGVLYVAGAFTTIGTGAGSRAIANVAKYDGTTWSDLGAPPADPMTVRVLGGKVYLGGVIPDVGVQVYDGTAWTAIPFGTKADGQVKAIDEQNGELVVAGRFRLDDAARTGSIARLKGANWELVGGGLQGDLGFNTYDIGSVEDLLVTDTKIYATGLFARAGDTSVGNIAVFDTETSSWSAMGGGITGNSGGVFVDTLPLGNTLTAAGGNIYVGGGFSLGGSRAAVGVARWEGNAWSAPEDPTLTRLGVNGDAVEAIASDGNGGVYVGGTFEFTGIDLRTPQIAHFVNGAWNPLGEGLDGRVFTIATDDRFVYAGGAISRSGTVKTPSVARWDGTAWSPLGAGLDAPVWVLVKGPEGKLYAGGDFTTSGDTRLNFIAVWDGMKWSALGSGLDGSVNTIVFDDQGKLYAGGLFTHAGAKDAKGVARWDGTEWSSVGEGLKGSVNDLVIYDSKLTAGGEFRLVEAPKDGPPTNLAAWDGESWKTLGGGTHGEKSIDIGGVYSLSVRQRELYVGGNFVSVGDDRSGNPRVPAKFLARWNGTAWSEVGASPNDLVIPVLATNDALWVGGAFTLIGQTRSTRIGRYVFGSP